MWWNFKYYGIVRVTSVNIEITADDNQVIIGDSIYVFINISSDTVFGDIEANLVYDEEILEYMGSVHLLQEARFLKISILIYPNRMTTENMRWNFRRLR